MQINVVLGILVMSLIGCLLGGSAPSQPMTSLPAGTALIVFHDGQGLTAVDASGGVVYRWTPKPASAAELQSKAAFLYGNTLLAREGLSFELPLPRGGRDPSLSPDRTRVAFTQSGEGMASSVSVMNLDGTGLVSLTSGGASPTWLPDGSVGLRSGDQRNGTEIFRVSADGQRVLKVAETGGDGVAYLDWSADGQRVAYSVATEGGARIDEAPADGGEGRTLIEVPGGALLRPRWSPDGRRIAAMARLPAEARLTAPTTLWVVDGTTGQGRAILDLPAKAPSLLPRGGYKGVREFAWSPDGESLAFFAAMSGDCNQNVSGELLCRNDLYTVKADGTGLRRLVKLRSAEPARLEWIR